MQPEDLLLHEFAQSRAEGKDVAYLEQRWLAVSGGSLEPPATGATPSAATPQQQALAGQLLDELDALTTPADPAHPETLAEIEAGWTPASRVSPEADLPDRLRGAWWGRAAGCLLGKPVEKLPRAGIHAIATATANWPVSRYFTAVGLDAATAAAWPWNRHSATISLAENIDTGCPRTTTSTSRCSTSPCSKPTART